MHSRMPFPCALFKLSPRATPTINLSTSAPPSLNVACAEQTSVSTLLSLLPADLTPPSLFLACLCCSPPAVTGSVVWTGTSALDIQMQLWQEDDKEDAHDQQPSLVALFSFVHLDPVTKKPAPVVQLMPGTEREKAIAAQRQALADARRVARKASAQGDRVVVSPEADKWMRPLLREARTLVDMPALAPSDAVAISTTSNENIFLTVPQQQNMHGRIFGGFLMRRAFELGFATAYLFGGRRPDFIMVDEISFKKPVDVGNLLRLKSR